MQIKISFSFSSPDQIFKANLTLTPASSDSFNFTYICNKDHAAVHLYLH